MLQHVLGKPGIEFDGRKFEHLGVPAQDTTTIGITKVSGVTSIDNWLATKKTLNLGGVGPGAATDDVAKIVRATIGVPMRSYRVTKARPTLNWPSTAPSCMAW